VLLGIDREVHLLMFLLLSSYYILSRSLEDVGTEELGQSSSGLTYCIMIWVWSFGEWVGGWVSGFPVYSESGFYALGL
jgi:hypothetical protein